jgi:competence protein ComEC
MKKQTIQNIIYTFVVIIGFIAAIYYFLKDNEEPKPTKEVIATLEVEFIDVGQADCTLIRHQEHNILIDAGNNKDGKLLVKYFQDLGITKFDYVIGTHPHEDHIGGLDDIISSFDVEHVMMPDVTTNTKTFTDVLDAVEKKELTVEVPVIDETFKVGDLTFKTIYTGTNPEDLNADSIILRLDYKNNSYLFTADTTSDVEQTILDKDLDVDIYKVAHHCSVYSNSYEFLEKVTPEYAIISLAKENDYYYPHIKAVNRIKKHTDKIYMTSENGTIIVKDDGDNINIDFKQTKTDGDRK